jgi:WS/DGAT/MGAT family acyltransferase
MKQLSALDNMFLSLEHGNQTMHVASLGIYNPATAPGGKVRFKQILAHYASRLDKMKVFQRHLVKVPLGIDLPFWLDEGAIDLEYHVRHIALPHPGDWRQLMIQVARLHSRPLDLTKPLWETYVIEGLDNVEGLPPDSFAIYCKMHHSMVDGDTGVELMRIQHDLQPIGRSVDRLTTYVADRDPTRLELVSRGLSGRAERVLDAGRSLFNLGRVGLSLGGKLLKNGALDPAKITAVLRDVVQPGNPVTRFSGDISPHRMVTGVALPLADFQVIRSQLKGITVNDIFLAITGGAVRCYLAGKNELPAETLHAAVPVSTHGEKRSADEGNSVSGTLAPLLTHIADPVERVHGIHAAMEKNKEMMGALGRDLIKELSQLAPMLPPQLLLKHVVAKRASIIVSNVRGPNVPLYFAGAQLVRFLPISIATNGIGLNVTGFSYDDQLWICAVSCRKMIPDPEAFTACLQASLDELKRAVTAAAASPKRKPRAKSAKTAVK